METWLNQPMIEQMETASLVEWREHIVYDMGRLTTFLAQIDHALNGR